MADTQLDPDQVEEYLAALSEDEFRNLAEKSRYEYRGLTGPELGRAEAEKRFGKAAESRPNGWTIR